MIFDQYLPASEMITKIVMFLHHLQLKCPAL